MVSQLECPACGATDKTDKRKVWITERVTPGMGTNRIRVECNHTWHNPATEVKPDSGTIGHRSTM